ncbi:tetratricopeptide repeat protein [Oceanihabitans sp. IOP_32]|uniref:tetratricopeptide repeat protein n=1 Tax=Oceanihabitans sp. IOP_32 TaxID=2529032 RepID=UPI0012930BEB|nr:tetratricopeptide repeat protein [Oceanihabitans sp. IOP_32]QFZ54760.1 tetratricopeptide repeat protein [Oceanihabitans sp. IOP_32]
MSRLLCVIFILVIFKTQAQTSVLKHADSLFAYGHYSKAIVQYKTHNNLPEVYYKMAKAFIAIGNYDESLVHYKKAVETNPKNSLLKYDFARFLYQIKKYKSASKVFEELVYTDSKNPNFHYELGLALEQLNDSTAQHKFYSAFELDSTHQKAIYKIAKAHLKKRRFKTANKLIDIGLSSYKNNKQLISLKAQNYYAQKQYRAAIIWFEKLLELGESSMFIHEMLATAYSYLYHYEMAIHHQEIVLNFRKDKCALIKNKV